ncbi:uncharacterized protein N0V89_009038 [Didymosphaeria variabile]|uniref:amidase n=1 Tax=Didymosphaeria variabile TaxID=1932322 RepID=A0A9W8XIR5_9PLEO|nr:uncharacterized protein N0V89_009038 [Didymosphaeria variabile]KAJ4350417.1 hypothetical protein N0V89_009038 [Didymosphaeria variabile]
MTTSWQDRARQKREAILAAIPPEWVIKDRPSIEEQRDVTGEYIRGFLSEREVEITETDAEKIVDKTTTGAWKAEEITRAFCHRAALAHQLLHCLHEIFFDAAIESARSLDAYFAEHGKPVGPLHGLPVSLKDQFHVKDVETTMGYVGWIGTFEGKVGTGKEKVFESEMVRELRNLGAVLYCKTSVPHTLMAGETTNNIIGYTLNPKNRNLTAGGSSGGEGALIGIKGSPIGFGTDIGGSIRIPAAFNGLYGIRPTSGRFPYQGMANSMDGQNTILSVVGPLATTAGSLRLMTKAILSQQPWLHDPMVHEMPWRDSHEQGISTILNSTGSSEGGKLCFGVMPTDGIVNPSPPIRRAIDIVVKALRSHGHEVVDWNPPSHRAILDEAFKTWDFDAGSDLKSSFALSGGADASTSRQLRCAAKALLRQRDIGGEPLQSSLRGPRQDQKSILPVTEVDKDIDVVDVEYTPLDERDKICHESYDPSIYDGAHVGVQLVGRRLQEEKMLAIAEYVGKIVGK